MEATAVMCPHISSHILYQPWSGKHLAHSSRLRSEREWSFLLRSRQSTGDGPEAGGRFWRRKYNFKIYSTTINSDMETWFPDHFCDSPVNSEDVVQHLIEEHQRDVQLFLIEDLQTGLHIVPQLLLFHWDVVLRPKTKSVKMGFELFRKWEPSSLCWHPHKSCNITAWSTCF